MKLNNDITINITDTVVGYDHYHYFPQIQAIEENVAEHYFDYFSSSLLSMTMIMIMTMVMMMVLLVMNNYKMKMLVSHGCNKYNGGYNEEWIFQDALQCSISYQSH